MASSSDKADNKKTGSKKTGFSAIDMNVAASILEQGGTFNQLAAFVVLACHTAGNGKSPHQLSTAGVKATKTKTGMSYRKAELALEWLCQHEIITPIKAQPNVPRARQARWRLRPLGEDLVYLPHTLVHSLKDASPPLSRIYETNSIGPTASTIEARTHILWLLLTLYSVHSMEDFGGIDPNDYHREWIASTFENFMCDDLYFTRFTRDDSHTVMARFAKECFEHDFFGKIDFDKPEPLGYAIFWHAVEQLEALGFIYEVVQCWDSDPVENENAEILFPIHVFDKHATDHHISKYVNRIVTKFMDDIEDWFIFSKSTEWVFYCPSVEPNPIVISSLRLRFRPSTLENSAGFSKQNAKCEHWRLILEKYEHGDLIHLASSDDD